MRRSVENEAVSRPDGTLGTSERAASRRGGRVTLLAVLAVAFVGVASAGVVLTATANGTAPLMPLARPSLPFVQPERVLVEPERKTGLAPEELGSTAIDTTTSGWIESLQTAVRDDPDFGSLAISEDHDTVTITWYREPSATLREQIRSAPAALEVVVQAAAFRPAELQGLVLEAMRPGLVPGVQVTSGGSEADGSGLRLGISELPAGQTPGDVAHDIAAALGRTDVPISIEVSGPVIAITDKG